MTTDACIPTFAPGLRSAAHVPSTPIRWLGAVRNLRIAVLKQARETRRAYPARRSDFFETAAMAREMHRL